MNWDRDETFRHLFCNWKLTAMKSASFKGGAVMQGNVVGAELNPEVVIKIENDVFFRFPEFFGHDLDGKQMEYVRVAGRYVGKA